MSDEPIPTWDEAPTVEVRVYRHGELVFRQLCESEDEAIHVIDEWSELDGVEFEVDDLSFRHTPGQILEPEPSALSEEDYPFDVGDEGGNP